MDVMLWIWVLVAIEIGLLFLFDEFENGRGATLSLVVFALVLQYWAKVDLIGYCQANPRAILTIALAYFGIGVMWGIFKWKLFCAAALRRYNDLKTEFLGYNGIVDVAVVPPELRQKWINHLDSKSSYVVGEKQSISDTPLARKNKARIMRWMTLWVISMLGSIFHDLVAGLFHEIYYRIASFLQKIANNTWAKGNVKEDLQVLKEPKSEQPDQTISQNYRY